jgi:hypothetical protein
MILVPIVADGISLRKRKGHEDGSQTFRIRGDDHLPKTQRIGEIERAQSLIAEIENNTFTFMTLK